MTKLAVATAAEKFEDHTLIINEYGMNKETILPLFNDLHPQLEFTSKSWYHGHSRQVKHRYSNYHKKAVTFNYLHFGSNHPCHTKRNISCSLPGIVSKKNDRIAKEAYC